MAHKPKPFQRPGIDIGHHGRAWLKVRAGFLKSGDTVQSLGLVTAVTHRDAGAVFVDFFSGEWREFAVQDEVQAFVRQPEESSD